MTQAITQRDSRLFYSGLLISSIGSMTFTIGLIVFMAKEGFSLFQISLIVGLSRILPVLVSTLLGDWADRLSPRRTVLVTEVLAGLSSIGVLFSWSQAKASYLVLLSLCLIRSVILATQLGSRAKLVKQMSDASYESNSRNTILFNQATQGATLFAGMLAWVAFQYVNFPSIIALDALSFLVNGILLLKLNSVESPGIPSVLPVSLTRKFRDLYTYNGRTAALDACLAFAMMGTASLNTRLAGEHQEWNAVLLISYGLAVWAAGGLERSPWGRRLGSSLWIGLGVAYSSLGFIPPGFILIAVSFIKDTFFWTLFHRVSTRIQMDTPAPIVGSVSHARNAQMVLILATGELVVGAWQGIVPLGFEGLWRGTLCLTVGVVTAWMFKKPTTPAVMMRYAHVRPTL